MIAERRRSFVRPKCFIFVNSVKHKISLIIWLLPLSTVKQASLWAFFNRVKKIPLDFWQRNIRHSRHLVFQKPAHNDGGGMVRGLPVFSRLQGMISSKAVYRDKRRCSGLSACLRFSKRLSVSCKTADKFSCQAESWQMLAVVVKRVYHKMFFFW